MKLKGKIVNHVAILVEKVPGLVERNVMHLPHARAPETVEHLGMHFFEPLQIRARQEHAGMDISLHNLVGVAGTKANDILANRCPQSFRDNGDHAKVHKDNLKRAASEARRSRLMKAKGGSLRIIRMG